MVEWFAQTLRNHSEIAIFLSIGIGYWIGGKSVKGFSIGTVSATLIVGVLLGQFDITVSSHLKAVFFLMFLFAIGYGIGPQFVRAIAGGGLPQGVFAALQCVISLAVAYLVARLAGYDLGYSAGLYSGSQTISASVGLVTETIERLKLPAGETTRLINTVPIAYAVTFIFGEAGSAIILAKIGPRLLGIDLAAACRLYEAKMAGDTELGGPDSAWHQYEVRAYRVKPGTTIVGKTLAEVEALVPHEYVVVERLRRDGKILEAKADTVIAEGDVLAIAGRRSVLVDIIGHAEQELDDLELLDIPIDGVDVYVTNKTVDGATIADVARRPAQHGVFVRKIARGHAGTSIPILPATQIHRGDILTLAGRKQDVAVAAADLGYADRATDAADIAFIGLAIAAGTLIGAIVIPIGTVPLTITTAGGALIAGLIFGWLRSVHPTFGRIPSSAVWFMSTIGICGFLAAVGISAGSGFVAGVRQVGVSLFLWGIAATSVPLLLGMLAGRFIFRFDPAILFGCCAGARTSSASIGLICETAKSQIPTLGYTVPYAIGNTLLTVWGMVIVILLA